MSADQRSTPSSDIERIGILGAGRVGTALARTLIDAGFSVSLAGSGDPGLVTMIAGIVAPGAEADWASDAAAGSDLVVLALPLHRLPTVNPALLDGRLVVDAMNYWPPVDGEITEFEGAADGTSVVVQRLLAGARVLKTFNHTGYHDLEPDRRPAGHVDRRAMAVAGDGEEDVAAVAAVIERIGYDAVPLDSLAAGRLLQPGEASFGARLTADEMSEALRLAPIAPTR
jgi:predicted dinucleotide-binding enzyme